MTRARVPTAVLRWWPLGRGRPRPPEVPIADLPLRADLLGTDALRLHGEALAVSHQVATRRAPDRLLARLAENEEVICATAAALARATTGPRIPPAGEWVLDNLHLVEDQIRAIRRDLPPKFGRELPQLAGGPSAGLPRVYDIAQEAVAHGDGRVDAAALQVLIEGYQARTPLLLAELWALPIMLRITLVENLRRICTRLRADRAWVERGHAWAGRLLELAESDPKSVVLAVADLARSPPEPASAFVAEVARHLHARRGDLSLALGWIEQWLSEAGTTIEDRVHAEHLQQAEDQLTVGNTIGTLRFVATWDWRAFVERNSVVERALLRDPASVHGRMDFATRDQYRHRIERVARESGRSELEVAETALALAAREAGDAVRGHVGYWLVDEGLPELLSATGARGRRALALHRAAGRMRIPGFFATLAAVTGLIVAAIVPAWAGLAPLVLVGVAVPALFVASDLAVALLAWAATQGPPKRLPSLDPDAGIPPGHRTLVAIPTLVGPAEEVDALVDGLEVRYLANRDPLLHFALVTDFYDADREVLPGDDALVAHAVEAMAALRRRHPEAPDAFFLFHRPRTYDPCEGRCLGAERKRGKLNDVNDLLRGMGRERFSVVDGDASVLDQVTHVLTLDRDTELPLGAARALVAIAAHPLVAPRLAGGRVVRGHGLLQPRVGSSFASTRTRYARACGADPGMDPYTRSGTSDLYQDLFSEGSAFGKGLHHVDTFRAVAGGLPPNRILSHDLLEGCLCRSALASEVLVIEDHPPSYLGDARRRHRWVRGDWQLLWWLGPLVPSRDGWVRNPLSALGRWKIADNLRRSLVAPSLVALLWLAWAAAPRPAATTLLLLAVPFVAPSLGVLSELVRKPRDSLWRMHVDATRRTLGRGVVRSLVTLATLPDEAARALDAIVRTLWRVLVTGRRLLEWDPSHRVDGSSGRDPLALWYLAMAPSPLLAALAAAGVASRPEAVGAAAPVLAAWALSPAILRWSARPSVRVRRRPLRDQDRAMLRGLARRTWGFFEATVGEAEHWLPPDNLQEVPEPVVAHRTSPTNIGLALLSGLAAHDLGYVSTSALVTRTAATLRTVARLERDRGHPYNWYDTRTLAPLPPRFVSSVDNGNLAAALVALRQGLFELRDAPLLPERTFEGLADTLALVGEGAVEVGEAPGSLRAARQRLSEVAAAASALAAGLPPESEARV